jgi:protein-S-isoprenylcysteine O-methyltransferase Ste14
MTEEIFEMNVTVLLGLLVGTIWSAVYPSRRIWPPPGKKSWQYLLTWVGFSLACALNIPLYILDWNTWLFDSLLRLIVGVPLVLLGGLLACWGIATLGVKNTSGQKDGFVSSGPYRFTRNPQYLGDIILFVGLSVITNSALL